MIEKPLKDKLIDLLKEVISTLKGEDKEETTTTEPVKPEENTDEDKGPIEPEMGGYTGF
jgi:predicted AlkP superfamily phosphohydrolase/phosphomutase